jgi:hypothetical protein
MPLFVRVFNEGEMPQQHQCGGELGAKIAGESSNLHGEAFRESPFSLAGAATQLFAQPWRSGEHAAKPISAFFGECFQLVHDREGAIEYGAEDARTGRPLLHGIKQRLRAQLFFRTMGPRMF